MKLLVFSLLILTSYSAHADEDLEVDSQFFHSAKGPYEDDELDRATKKDPLAVKTKQQLEAESAVKSEFNSVQPGLMKSYEAAAMDQAVINENKRREKAILSRLAAHTPVVKECVAKSKEKFKGTHITMKWLISKDGKTLETAVKSTDVQDPLVEKCIYESALKITFNEAATDHLKQSMAEYTYKFKIKSRAPASVKRAKTKMKKSKARSRQAR